MKIRDEVTKWRITIEGIDSEGNSIVRGRAEITRLALDCCKIALNEGEFKMLWNQVMNKSEEDLK